jgi:hypothetical protein
MCKKEYKKITAAELDYPGMDEMDDAIEAATETDFQATAVEVVEECGLMGEIILDSAESREIRIAEIITKALDGNTDHPYHVAALRSIAAEMIDKGAPNDYIISQIRYATNF